MNKIAQKITWQEPDDDTITKVYIYKSTTIYGTYNELTNIDATDDGQPKSSSNSWVTTYTDTSGTRTDWYKIRFYDGTNDLFSEYSDPVTSEELLRLCTVDDVKSVINTVGRWTDDEIFDMITKTDDLIYIEAGTPLQGSWSLVEEIDEEVQDTYYVGEENIYRVDRVFYGTATKVELFLDDEYKANNRYGMIRVLPYASSGIELSADDNQDIEIQFVPRIYNSLSMYRTAKALLEQIDTTSGGNSSKELEVIQNHLDIVEMVLKQRIGLQASNSKGNYDYIYGVNTYKIVQDFSRNKYVGKYGW